MIKNNKLKTILSSAVILLPMVFGLVMWNKIPDELVSHIGLDGKPDAFSHKSLLIFGLPLVFFVLHLLGLWLSDKDPGHKNQTKKAMGMIFWILPVASLFVNSLMYFIAFEMEFNPMILVVSFLAFMFIFIGNYMPTCKQSATVGIKIKWTLENVDNWRATHRFSGKVWFICGLLLIPFAFLPEKYAPALLTSIIFPVALLPVCYSYLYYKKQVKEGTYSADNSIIKEVPKSYKKVSIAVLAILAVVFPVTMFTGDIDFVMGETALEIQADFYNDATIPYDSIDDIEYRDATVDGIRSGGFGSAKLLMGKFKNDEFGYYTRYTYAGDTDSVVITIDDDKLVIAGESKEATKAIYDALIEKVK